jgi:hypothetical protein
MCALQVVRLPCLHMFHSACVKAWFSRRNAHNRCPLCRHVASDHDDGGGGGSSGDLEEDY